MTTEKGNRKILKGMFGTDGALLLTPEQEYEARSPDHVMEMPHWGERLVGRDAMRAMQDAYPNPPDATVRRIVGAFRTVMRKAVLVVLGVLLVACGQGEDGAADPGAAASNPSAASTTKQRGEPIVIRTSVDIAPTPGAEVIATGHVLEGSTLGGSPFCVGGSIRDSHGSTDPEVWLIARTITCPDGKVRMDLRPEVPEGLNQVGSWKIVSGTGDFDGLSGSGEAEIAYDADPEVPARETYTGTATH